MGADADIFMILLRPTRVPIVGESVSHLFQGQVLIESMTWNLHNEEERKRAKADTGYSDAKLKQDQQASKGLRAEILEDEKRSALKQQKADRNAAIEEIEDERTKSAFKYQRALATSKTPELLEKSYQDDMARLRKGLKKRLADIDSQKLPGAPEDSDAKEREAKLALADEMDRNLNFEITFTKRVDLSSTQMLNSMKAGDIFPSGTLTIHKRSATAADGTSLVFTIQKIRLLDYKLVVSVSDMMTEMMEKWTCEFGALAYVYKNPPSHYSHGNAVQGAAKAASQGTMRAFTMKNIGSPL